MEGGAGGVGPTSTPADTTSAENKRKRAGDDGDDEDGVGEGARPAKKKQGEIKSVGSLASLRRKISQPI